MKNSRQGKAMSCNGKGVGFRVLCLPTSNRSPWSTITAITCWMPGTFPGALYVLTQSSMSLALLWFPCGEYWGNIVRKGRQSEVRQPAQGHRTKMQTKMSPEATFLNTTLHYDSSYWVQTSWRSAEPELLTTLLHCYWFCLLNSSWILDLSLSFATTLEQATTISPGLSHQPLPWPLCSNPWLLSSIPAHLVVTMIFYKY